jgi:predicted nucleotidyltransferase
MRVYTPNEVANQRFPASIDAIEMELARLKHFLPEVPGLIGAAVGGSVVRGTATIASDIDGIVLIQHAQADNAFATLNKIDLLISESHVPLDLAVVTDYQAKNKSRSLSLDYMELLKASPWVIGDDPFPLLHNPCPKPSFNYEVRKYTNSKLDELSRYRIDSHPAASRRAKMRSEVLSAPIHVARRTLQARGLASCSDERLMQEVDTHFPLLGQQLGRIWELRREYSVELASQLDHSDSKRYQIMLNRIDEHIPLAWRIYQDCDNLLSRFWH